MIPARHSWLGRQFWGGFSRWGIKLAFSEMNYPKDFAFDQKRPVLLLGNHISWWDGFWPLELNRRFFRKRYHVMMLEEELQKRPFMAQGGAFSIQPGSRDLINSLHYAAELLQQPENLVLIYPQGKIHSQHEHRIRFNPGVNNIIKRAGEEPQVIFSAALLDYGAKARPALNYYLRHWDWEKGVEKAYQTFFDEALKEQAIRGLV
jgi:1-acyl-sn-glycerol-3-phosphate acyltransferase